MLHALLLVDSVCHTQLLHASSVPTMDRKGRTAVEVHDVLGPPMPHTFLLKDKSSKKVSDQA